MTLEIELEPPTSTGGMGLNRDRETEFLSDDSALVSSLLIRIEEMEKEIICLKMKRARPQLPKRKSK